jgi:hypothetical protein
MTTETIRRTTELRSHFVARYGADLDAVLAALAETPDDPDARGVAADAAMEAGFAESSPLVVALRETGRPLADAIQTSDVASYEFYVHYLLRAVDERDETRLADLRERIEARETIPDEDVQWAEERWGTFAPCDTIRHYVEADPSVGIRADDLKIDHQCHYWHRTDGLWSFVGEDYIEAVNRLGLEHRTLDDAYAAMQAEASNGVVFVDDGVCPWYCEESQWDAAVAQMQNDIWAADVNVYQLFCNRIPGFVRGDAGYDALDERFHRE